MYFITVMQKKELKMLNVLNTFKSFHYFFCITKVMKMGKGVLCRLHLSHTDLFIYNFWVEIWAECPINHIKHVKKECSNALANSHNTLESRQQLLPWQAPFIFSSESMKHPFSCSIFKLLPVTVFQMLMKMPVTFATGITWTHLS